jgi:hypothetical protein
MRSSSSCDSIREIASDFASTCRASASTARCRSVDDIDGAMSRGRRGRRTWLEGLEFLGLDAGHAGQALADGVQAQQLGLHLPSLTAMALRFSRTKVLRFLDSSAFIAHAAGLQEGQAHFRGVAHGDVGEQEDSITTEANMAPANRTKVPPGQRDASCGCKAIGDENNMQTSLPSGSFRLRPVTAIALPGNLVIDDIAQPPGTPRVRRQHGAARKPRPTSAPIPASLEAALPAALRLMPG